MVSFLYFTAVAPNEPVINVGGIAAIGLGLVAGIPAAVTMIHERRKFRP
ncbi:MAG: hypothetical protein SPI77_00450 [Corynebacterium sp.]|nr:hypothetical protein [Corynebacterium sp.]